MTAYNEAHLDWEVLNDLVDGRLSRDVRQRAERHLATCLSCRAAREELARLLVAASEVPAEVEPPPALWGEIRDSLSQAAREDRSDDAQARRRGAARDGIPARWLAAAAVLLIVASSAITATWIRREETPAAGPTARAQREEGTGSARQVPALPASLARAEAAYLSDAEALRALFDRERGTLSPSTVAVVERSLATIDAAIAEARSALLSDPSNAALAQFLDSNYRQKVELLRRATKLGART